ncbi:Endoplasmic reticulum-Golgi intermediate compartment protein [Penicillium ucsense]|uniref:Endoplasmic reticulum-Golgi intermediate compartment protein n=1 Tax=Penicillium ucsense TaxID=2839758 RepID=A0A8J8W290_9EURO|nr:Endoplasmic reticulum-Golgi intermediate compartment protein [Penicillium ucsense]KAF7734377.1 Endoplasmic reticulum-Golgi intermediate compartment protein [Penicillium ucsense]
MNGYEPKGLDEDAFGDKGTKSGLKTFDAFPKTKASYTTPTTRGGQWTVLILAICTLLGFNELRTWWRGTEQHQFSVEKGVSHELQLNLDMVIHMPCDTLRVNIQDAAGDRILAGDLLQREETSWKLWMDKRNHGSHEYQTLNHEEADRLSAQEADAHAHHVIGEVRRNPRRKFPKGPRMRWGEQADACRIYGSLEGNKVQGDFHITARGHGYRELGEHLSHEVFNFSHMITELSFGPHYPNLMNPLDKTIAETENHYQKFQYFLSVVPTLYTKGRSAFDAYTRDPSSLAVRKNRNAIFTNQYAATSQSTPIPETPYLIPGIFFKYNIEPIMLLVSEERTGFLTLLIRVINTISGVLVTGGWVYQISGWVGEFMGKRRRQSEGVLTGKHFSD